MSAPFDLTLPLPDLGELLAKLKKAGKLDQPPTLAEILAAHEMKSSRRAKEELLEGIRRVFKGDHVVAEKVFDEIFPWGKRHPSADRLFGVGTDLGMMWLGGIRGGGQSLDDIMAECHIDDEHIAKKYIMEGLIAIVGKAEAKIAWKRIFPRVQYADLARLEARALGWQQKLGTLHDPDTLIDFTHACGATNTGTVRDLVLEELTDLFGEEEGKDLCGDIFPHALNPKIIALLHLEGHQLAELWKKEKLVIFPTLTDYIRVYDVSGRDTIRKYLLEGMQEFLDEKKALAAYLELFSQKSNLTDQKIAELHDVGHKLGNLWKQGKRTAPDALVSIMDNLDIGDARTAKRHIIVGIREVLTEAEAESAWEVYFSKEHEKAEELRQLGRNIARETKQGKILEHKSIREIADKLGVNRGTAGTHIYEGMVLEVGEREAKKIFKTRFPNDLHAVLGVYNHIILEAGLVDVVTSNFEDPKHAPTITTEKLEGDVKHDVLIENIQEGGWFQKQLVRLTPQHDTFQEALKLTDAAVAGYSRVSGDLSTWDEPGRLEEKDEKYGDEHTLFLMVLTKYNETDKYTVRIPDDRPNARVISGEMFFLLCGAKTPALELVRKVRDLTRQGKVEELRKWKQKVDIGTAPSFLTGQQTLDEWLEAENEAGEAAEEEGDPDEKEDEKDKGKATGEKQPEKAREKGEEKPERTSVGQEPASNNKNDLRQTEQVHNEDRQRESNLKIGPDK